tara:strand:- start:5573 stop:5791 length:219 start_codon:yes stop_codon:yes gene_type:complete
MYKLEGHSDLARDPKTNSIINVNSTDYQQYIARRSVKDDEIEKSQNVEQELSDLKCEINEIKSLLKELVNGN